MDVEANRPLMVPEIIRVIDELLLPVESARTMAAHTVNSTESPFSTATIKAQLGPGFRQAEPLDSPLKDLTLRLVSISGHEAILSGAISGKSEFALIAKIQPGTQAVEVLASDPGNLNLLISDLSEEFHLDQPEE